MISVTPLPGTAFDIESFVLQLKPEDYFVAEFHSNLKFLYHVEHINQEGYQLIWYSEHYSRFRSCKTLTTTEMISWLCSASVLYRVELKEIKVNQIGPTLQRE